MVANCLSNSSSGKSLLNHIAKPHLPRALWTSLTALDSFTLNMLLCSVPGEPPNPKQLFEDHELLRHAMLRFVYTKKDAWKKFHCPSESALHTAWEILAGQKFLHWPFASMWAVSSQCGTGCCYRTYQNSWLGSGKSGIKRWELKLFSALGWVSPPAFLYSQGIALGWLWVA